MVVSTVVIPLIILNAIGASAEDTTFIIQMALLIAGVATILQTFSIGPVGARLPIVMGTSSIFVAPLIDIGNSFTLAAIFGAVIIASPVEILIGYFIDEVRQLFPPLVTGIVIMLIGLSVISVAMSNAGGGAGSETYGNLANLGLAGIVVVLSILLNSYFDGLLAASSILIGIVVAYVVALAMGMVDFTPVADAGWVSAPVPLRFGLEFEPSAILLVAFAYIINTIETIGDIEGTTSAIGRDATNEEMRGGLVADGVMSAVASVFGAFPNTSFSQNVGLITFTGVASRIVVATTGVILIVLGFIPKLSAVVTAMPTPIIGGAVIVLFGMIIAIGVRILSKTELTRRNLTIIGTSIVLGLGVEISPEILQQLPSQLQVLAGSGLIAGGVTAVVLNLILPGDGGEVSRGTVVADAAVDDD
jgi:xanthine permease